DRLSADEATRTATTDCLSTQMETRMNHPLSAVASLAALALVAGTAQAQISDNVVRIGVMSDQTGPYSGNGGPGSVLAVRMAVEDFGGKVNGVPIEVVVAD